METSDRLGLNLPELTDGADIRDLVANFEKLDEVVAGVGENVSVTVRFDALAEYLDEMPKNLSGAIYQITVPADTGQYVAGFTAEGFHNGTLKIVFVNDVTSDGAPTKLISAPCIFKNISAKLIVKNMNMQASTTDPESCYIMFSNCSAVYPEGVLHFLSTGLPVGEYVLIISEGTKFYSTKDERVFDDYPSVLIDGSGAIHVDTYAMAEFRDVTIGNAADVKLMSANGARAVFVTVDPDDAILPSEMSVYGGAIISNFHVAPVTSLAVNNSAVYIPKTGETMYIWEDDGGYVYRATVEIGAVRDGVVYFALISGAIPNTANGCCFSSTASGSGDPAALGTAHIIFIGQQAQETGHVNIWPNASIM